jgi:hypothetical protein
MSVGAHYLFRTPESVDNLGPGMLAFLRRTVADRGPQFVKHGDYRDPRSLDQNAMFWAMCGEIAEFWNANRDEKTSPEAIARDLKITFGIVVTEYSPVSGKRGARIESTTKYTKRQMADLITATLAWAADEGIPIRDPRAEG